MPKTAIDFTGIPDAPDPLRERIKAHESLNLTPYADKGKLSVGYGHRGVGQGDITEEQAERYLDDDLTRVGSQYEALELDLDDTRAGVVKEMIFWHGLKGFNGFEKTIKALEAGEFETAADELMNSESGRTYKTRMTALAGLMRSGDPKAAASVDVAGIDLSAIPDADFQNSQAEAKSMMGEAWKTCQEIGNVYPMAEAAAHLLSGIGGGSAAGLGGLFSLPFIGSEGASGVIETINKWLVYQPQTKAGTSLSETALYPLKKLEQAGSMLGGEVMDRTGNPYLAAAVYTAIAGAPALIGLRSLPKVIQGKIQTSTAWRQMNIKERGLVLQGLEETIRKNPDMTEGQIVRRWEGLREESMARRAEGEKVAPSRGVEEVKPGVEKPKPPRDTPAEKFNREMTEIARKETDLTDAEIDMVFLGGEKVVKVTAPEYVYHGGSGIKALKDKFAILTPEQKQKLPSSNIGLTGLSMTTDINVAKQYSQAIGQTEQVFTAVINPEAKIYEVDTKGDGIDELFTDEQINDFVKQGYDAIQDVSGEKEFRALTKKAIIPEEIRPIPEAAKPKLPSVDLKITKKEVREATGQAKLGKMVEGLTERTALADQIRFEARAARDAYRAGKLEETVKHRNKAISLYRRRERLRAIRDYLAIPESVMKKLTRGRDIGLMSDWEFKKYKDDLLVKSVELTEQLTAKNRLIKLIADKRLQRVENYRRALELPPIGKMSIKELEAFEKLLEPFADEDIFLTERELETVDRTELKGIRTWREARLRLAKEVGATIEQIEAIKVHELDDYRYDTALAERNPFYRMLVTESARKLLEADARYYEIETKAMALAKKAEKSRARTLIERAIPQDKKIMEYMEAPVELKSGFAEQLTGAQLDFAHFMEEYFSNALDYLIQVQALTKGRENYFVHMRRTFLEEVKESGLKTAFLSLYKNYRQDEAVFNILDEDTGNILPMEKFFQFALHRSEGLLPTANITRAFTAYVRMFEKKRSYDELIPKMDIYAQALTPQIFTPRGLEIDRSIKKFVNKYINSKKGRRIRWVGKQNGVIDLTIRGVRTFTTLLDLGLNIPVSIASVVGEQATGLQGLGVKKYALGTKRLQTDQGKKIVRENIAFVGKSVFAELAEPGKIVTERFMQGIFSLFRVATVTANKQYLLGSLTKQEFESGKISIKRLAELKVDMGRWRKVTGAESLVGATGAGGAAVQYKTWAVPIMSTTLRDLKIFAKDMKTKSPGKALNSREAKELWRFFLLGSFVAVVGILVAAEKDDRSFMGQIKAKAYRELNTLMQGVGPGLWLSVPRILVFAKQLGANLQNILTLERYKTKRGLKGVEGLKRQLTPVAVKQLTREKKTKRAR